MARQDKRISALSLRLAGALLVAGACVAARRLVVLAQGVDPTRVPIAYLLALLAFGCASVGAALLVYGRHLLDPVPVADRWARQVPEPDEPGGGVDA